LIEQAPETDMGCDQVANKQTNKQKTALRWWSDVVPVKIPNYSTEKLLSEN